MTFGLVKAQLAELEHGEIEVRRRLQDLDRHTTDDVESGAPGLVAANDLVKGTSEACHIERAVLADGDRFVVTDLIRGETAQVPQGLLGYG